jgi:hypothetical protein
MRKYTVPHNLSLFVLPLLLRIRPYDSGTSTAERIVGRFKIKIGHLSDKVIKIKI